MYVCTWRAPSGHVSRGGLHFYLERFKNGKKRTVWSTCQVCPDVWEFVNSAFSYGANDAILGTFSVLWHCKRAPIALAVPRPSRYHTLTFTPFTANAEHLESALLVSTQPHCRCRLHTPFLAFRSTVDKSKRSHWDESSTPETSPKIPCSLMPSSPYGRPVAATGSGSSNGRVKVRVTACNLKLLDS